MQHHSTAQSAHRSLPCHSSRKFLPFELYGQSVDLDRVEKVAADWEWNFVTCASRLCRRNHQRHAHIDDVCIAIDGACRGNGTSRTRATVGVFVGFYSNYNVSDEIGCTTNQQAELHAGIIALEQALAINNNEPKRLDTLVIKPDSDYLYKSMTEYIFNWKENGYMDARRRPVQNGSLFRELEGLTQELNQRGVTVLFWHVRRAFNFAADMLANAALDGTEGTVRERIMDEYSDRGIPFRDGEH